MPEKKLVPRCISLPVLQCTSAPWDEFERQVIRCWELSTNLANWAAHTLRAHDATRLPGMKELPRLDAVDLYALAFGRLKERSSRERATCPVCRRQFFPSQLIEGHTPPHQRGTRKKYDCPGGQAVPVPRKVLPVTTGSCCDAADWGGGKIAASTVLRKVERDYKTYRGKIIWRQERRTPEYLFPFSFPVHQSQWEAFMMDGRPFVSIGLPGGRVTLRLKNGPDLAGKIKVFKQIAEGGLPHLELKITAESSRAHCRLVRDKRPGDEPARALLLMLDMVYKLEVYDSPADKIAVIKTGKAPLFSMTIEGDERPFQLFAEEIRQAIIAHRRFLDRFANDLKFEKRWPRRARKRRNRRQTTGCGVHARRMVTFREQAASQFVSHAARRGCGVIMYDDTDKSFSEEMPWFLIAQQFEETCAKHGLRFRKVTSGQVVEAAQTEKETATL